MLERPDFIFSYWIFTWYILYEFRMVSYNPKGALLIGLVENLILLGIMIYYSYVYILEFCIINLFIKILPLWRLSNTSYYVKDIYATLVLFFIYLIWVYFHQRNLNIVNIVETQLHHIQNNKPMGPFIYLLQKKGVI